MTTSSHVVVGFDFTASGQVALDRALALAARAPFHVLHVACVISPHTPFPAVPTDEAVDYRYAERVQESVANAICERLHAASITTEIQFFVHARIGKPATEIVELAEQIGADLILVGTKGVTGLERMVVGSVAAKVVRDALCTVEVVRPTAYPHVELDRIIDVGHALPYAPPHRYHYENTRVSFRPRDWPLY